MARGENDPLNSDDFKFEPLEDGPDAGAPSFDFVDHEQSQVFEFDELQVHDGGLMSEDAAAMDLGMAMPEADAESELADDVDDVDAVESSTGSSFLSRMAQVNPYTVLLGATVVVLIVGCSMLLVELSRYGFTLGPK